MPPAKRQKTEQGDVHEEPISDPPISEDEEANSSDSEHTDSEGGSSPDTDDEIAEALHSKSKKTQKRKRRATDATHFGSALQNLLSTNAPSSLPLSLKPSVARQRNDEKLEAKGKKIIQIERKEKEEKGRIRDVIGGWGGESERALRKVAQRGGPWYSAILVIAICLTTDDSCETVQCDTAITGNCSSRRRRAESAARKWQADAAGPFVSQGQEERQNQSKRPRARQS